MDVNYYQREAKGEIFCSYFSSGISLYHSQIQEATQYLDFILV